MFLQEKFDYYYEQGQVEAAKSGWQPFKSAIRN